MFNSVSKLDLLSKSYFKFLITVSWSFWNGFDIDKVSVIPILLGLLVQRCDTTNKQKDCLDIYLCDACAIWCHLYNFKNVKNTHGDVLLLVKLQAEAIAIAYKTWVHEAKRNRITTNGWTLFRNVLLHVTLDGASVAASLISF